MTMTSRKNKEVKALQSVMAKAKKHDYNALIEWELSCNTNSQRGKVYNQYELLDLYNRYGNNTFGASKAVHLYNHINNNEFKYIVIKRHQYRGYIDEHAYNPDTKQTGNQLIDEINCWLEFAEREESDLLNPILKYFTSKSDQVSAISETMQKNVVIIAQKAVYVSDAYNCCIKAEELNNENNLIGEDYESRYNKMKKMSRKQGWRDAMRNTGNSGVIFDYSKGCYKAVFIDYAL